MTSHPFGEDLVKLFVDYTVCLKDHTWHTQTVVLDWNRWDYENNLDVSYAIDFEAKKILRLIPDDIHSVFMYAVEEKIDAN